MKKVIHTEHAPKAIGPYSQAIQTDYIVFLSGQIPLDPKSMQLVGNDVAQQADQVFQNMQKVCQAAGGSLNDIVKLTIYLMDLNSFSQVNEVMVRYFKEPYPARTTIQVAGLPKDALIEVEGIMQL